MSLRKERAHIIAAKRQRRYAKAGMHKGLSYAAIGLAVAFLVFFFVDMIGKGASALQHSEIEVLVTYTDDKWEYESVVDADIRRFVSRGWLRSLPLQVRDNPDLKVGATEKIWALADSDVDKFFKYCDAESVLDDERVLMNTGINNANNMIAKLSANPATIGSAEQTKITTLQGDMSRYQARLNELKNPSDATVAELQGQCAGFTVAEVQQLELLIADNRVVQTFNTTFFTNSSSQMAEYAGILAAMVGSMMVLFLTMSFAVPVGVASAIYLEEFAPDNWFTRAIEININNLAAVPSIIFGLLGLAIFINFFGVPRNSSWVGGLTLGVMTLPVIIIATRAALRSVPDYIRTGAYGLGCTRWRVVRDHVLPLSLPGILTGSIIGLAQAMGETAPLIMIGLVANIAEVPESFGSATTVMPAQIFKWSDMPDRSFEAITAAGILVLLTVLLSMNAVAVFMRRRFERRW